MLPALSLVALAPAMDPVGDPVVRSAVAMVTDASPAATLVRKGARLPRVDAFARLYVGDVVGIGTRGEMTLVYLATGRRFVIGRGASAGIGPQTLRRQSGAAPKELPPLRLPRFLAQMRRPDENVAHVGGFVKFPGEIPVAKMPPFASRLVPSGSLIAPPASLAWRPEFGSGRVRIRLRSEEGDLVTSEAEFGAGAWSSNELAAALRRHRGEPLGWSLTFEGGSISSRFRIATPGEEAALREFAGSIGAIRSLGDAYARRIGFVSLKGALTPIHSDVSTPRD